MKLGNVFVSVESTNISVRVLVSQCFGTKSSHVLDD